MRYEGTNRSGIRPSADAEVSRIDPDPSRVCEPMAFPSVFGYLFDGL